MSLKFFNLTNALFILSCHIGAAIFFYIRANILGEQVYYWTALFIMAAAIPYVSALLRKRFIFYEGIYLFLAFFLVCHIARLFLNIDEITLELSSATEIIKLLIIGTVSFIVGYEFFLCRLAAQGLPIRNFFVANEYLTKFPLTLYLTGWALRLMPRLVVRMFPPGSIISKIIESFNGWQIVIFLMITSIYMALMIDAYIYFCNLGSKVHIFKKEKYLYRIIFFFTAEIIYGLLITGMKENILIPIILMLVVYLKARKKIPFIYIMLITSIFVVLFMPFTGTFRKMRENYEYTSTAKCAIETVENVFNKENFQDELVKAVKRVSAPLEMSVVSLELYQEGVEIKTYKDAADYLSRFVPRFLWPTKPSVDYNRIGKEMGILSEEDYTTSISPTLIGGLILNYGFYGVFIGMFIAGLIIRTYWEWLVVRTDGNLFSFIVYFLALYSWIRLDEITIILHANIALFLYVFVIVTLMKRKTGS